MCDGRGGCRPHARGVACGDAVCVDNRATGKVCDGLGVCSASADGVACGAYKCTTQAGCPTACTDSAQCAALYLCEGGVCVPERGASCDGDHTVLSPTAGRVECAPYRCEGATCKTSCVRKTDCAGDADCTADGRCVAFAPPPSSSDGCSCRTATRTESAGASFFAIASLATLRAIARRARGSRRTRRVL